MWIFLFLAFSFSSTSTSRWVFVGDSLTEGYGISKENAYPALLEKKINEYLKSEKKEKQIKIINAGVSGSTSASGLSRLKWHLKEPTELVLIALGANDGLRGQPIKNLKTSLKEMVAFAKSKQSKVIVAGMRLPQNYGKAYVQSFESTFREVRDEEKIVLIPFLLEGVAGKKDLNLNDGIHPNEKGHQIIAEKLFLFFKDQL